MSSPIPACTFCSCGYLQSLGHCTVFLRNHLGSKKNTFVIFVITFCNYPYATLLGLGKTTVNLLPRSPSKHAGLVHGVACFKEGVILGSCVNTMMKQEHTVWTVKPWSSKAQKPGQHIFCFCVTVKLAKRGGRKVVCSVNL